MVIVISHPGLPDARIPAPGMPYSLDIDDEAVWARVESVTERASYLLRIPIATGIPYVWELNVSDLTSGPSGTYVVLDGALRRYTDGDFVPVAGLQEVRSADQAPDGRLFASTRDGVFQLQSDGTWTPFSRHSGWLAVLADGSVVVRSEEGSWRLFADGRPDASWIPFEVGRSRATVVFELDGAVSLDGGTTWQFGESDPASVDSYAKRLPILGGGGRIWEAGHGLLGYDPRERTYAWLDLKDAAFGFEGNVAIAPDGTMAIANDHLWRVTPQGRLERIPTVDVVRYAAIADDQTIYAVVEDSVYRVAPGDFVPVLVQRGGAVAVAVDSAARLWVADATTVKGPGGEEFPLGEPPPWDFRFVVDAQGQVYGADSNDGVYALTAAGRVPIRGGPDPWLGIVDGRMVGAIRDDVFGADGAPVAPLPGWVSPEP